MREIVRALNALHGYIYGRWTTSYIRVLLDYIFPSLGSRGKKWWADRFHCKMITPEEAKAIITIDRNIPLHDLEQIIPYPMARNLVLKGPRDIVVYQCSCLNVREHLCQPTAVCSIIGQPFVDFILEQHPTTSRRIGQREALELIDAEHQRGHIQTAWFKDAMDGSFYALCTHMTQKKPTRKNRRKQQRKKSWQNRKRRRTDSSGIGDPLWLFSFAPQIGVSL